MSSCAHHVTASEASSLIHPAVSKGGVKHALGIELKAKSVLDLLMTQTAARVGNILGSGRAENDLLLDRAFLETAEFRNFAYSEDFHVAVGRRGTGKSALYRKLTEFYQRRSAEALLVVDAVQEHTAMSISHRLHQSCQSYTHSRAVMRIVWRVALLSQVAAELVLKRNVRSPKGTEWLIEHFQKLGVSAEGNVHDVCDRLLASACTTSVQELASQAARVGNVELLQQLVTNLLAKENKRGVVMVDRLDEGWAPDAVSTGIIGGLIHAATDLSERGSGVHTLVFVRDNIFRALAHFDPD